MRKGTRDSSLKNFKKVLSKRGEPHIRTAEKEDFAALLSLEGICFKEETFHRKQLRYLLLKAKSAVFVAEIENKIIGSMIILLRVHISNARIYSLNVHPAYRREGIGSLLMDAALKFLKERGFKKITLEAGVNNKAAQKLYHSKGFVLDKTLHNYYKSGDDAFRLIKKL